MVAPKSIKLRPGPNGLFCYFQQKKSQISADDILDRSSFLKEEEMTHYVVVLLNVRMTGPIEVNDTKMTCA